MKAIHLLALPVLLAACAQPQRVADRQVATEPDVAASPAPIVPATQVRMRMEDLKTLKEGQAQYLKDLEEEAKESDDDEFN